MKKILGFSLLELLFACSLLVSVLLTALLILGKQGIKINRVQQRWLHQQDMLNAQQS